MKKMLVAAAVVGSAIAGMILTVAKKRKINNNLIDASNSLIRETESVARADRPGHHAMG